MKMRIAEIRESQNLTQAKLGEMVGLTDASISRIETGLQSKTFDRLPKIAKALGVSVPELFDFGPEYRETTELLALIREIHRDDLPTARRILRGLVADQ